MSANIRKIFIDSYIEKDIATPFLTSFFKTGARDIVRADEIYIDELRTNDRIAPVISAKDERVPKIDRVSYEEKKIIPPKVGWGWDINAKDISGKIFGLDPFDSANYDYTMNLLTFNADKMRYAEKSINRNIEYQASQILQSGKLELQDQAGNVAYSIDYKPKATHFPTVATAWSDTNNSDPDGDIQNLYELILRDGKVRATNIIFGKNAWNNYMRNEKVKEKVNLRHANVGIVDPKFLHEDADFVGELAIGTNRFKCYVYQGFFTKADGTDTDFIDSDNVILMPDSESPNSDFRKIYGMVANITGVDPRIAGIMQALPDYMNLGDRAYTFRAWVNDSANSIDAELITRPILVPVSVNSFGCIKTKL